MLSSVCLVPGGTEYGGVIGWACCSVGGGDVWYTMEGAFACGSGGDGDGW